MIEPPRLARALIDRIVGDGERGRAIRGDLIEEFRRDGNRRRYWRHALSIALRYRAVRSEPVQEPPSMIEIGRASCRERV